MAYGDPIDDNSRDPKMSSRDPNMLWAQYLENS